MDVVNSQILAVLEEAKSEATAHIIQNSRARALALRQAARVDSDAINKNRGTEIPASLVRVPQASTVKEVIQAVEVAAVGTVEAVVDMEIAIGFQAVVEDQAGHSPRGVSESGSQKTQRMHLSLH